jgi:plastocyanin
MPRIWFLLAIALLVGSRPARAQRSHEVHLECAPDGASCRFQPTEVRAPPGDVLEFVVGSGGPFVIGFQPNDFPPEAHAAMNQAIPDRSGDLQGPLLRAPGGHLRVVVPPLPKGRYRFVAVTHVAYRMAGTLIVP